MVSDKVTAKTAPDTPASEPNWDVDVFISRINTSSTDTGVNNDQGGGKLRPNEGGGKLQGNPGDAPPAPVPPSEQEEGGGGKLKPFGDGGKLNPLGAGDGGGKLNPLGGDGGGKLNPLGGDGGGKLNGFDGAASGDHQIINGDHSITNIENTPLNGASSALENGDFANFKKAIEKAYEDCGCDGTKFQEFGDKLAAKMKGKGFDVKTGKGAIAIHQVGAPNGVEFKMDGELDFNTGKIKAEAKAQTYDWTTKQDVEGSPADAIRRINRGFSEGRPFADERRSGETPRSQLDQRLQRLMKPAPPPEPRRKAN
jgi:hypothetical protein